MKHRIPKKIGIILILFCSCQGPEGKIGPSGHNSLVNLIDAPPGADCPIGGVKIETGLDSNDDGILSDAEITQTKFVCDGNNGINSLTEISDEPEGGNCPQGGFKLQVGLDLNNNLELDPGEVQATKYICGIHGDKLERIEIGNSNSGSNSLGWLMISPTTNNLIKFNKLDYANVDSITFVPSIDISPDQGETPPKAYVELYNVTDGIEINHSQLESDTPDYVFLESRNIYPDLPAKEITVGIRMKVDNIHYTATTGLRSYLFIYKH